jgi:hypothetical protein
MASARRWAAGLDVAGPGADPLFYVSLLACCALGLARGLRAEHQRLAWVPMSLGLLSAALASLLSSVTPGAQPMAATLL